MTAHLTDALLERGWVVDTTLFSREDVAALRVACEAEWRDGKFHEAATGRAEGQRRRAEIRSDSVLWLDEARPSPALSRYFAILDEIRVAVNRQLFLGLHDLEAHFAVFPEGTFYKKHLDRFRDDDARTLTAVLYLNEAWQPENGGQMRLYLDEDCTDYRDIEPEAGTLALFLSGRFWHEVLPARCPRLSVTGWFRRRNESLPW
ncbi:2OG-Fe(II) oxygenase [Paludibacterium paludis]|uniref:Fe2OG dioxygenase domain-containing protein n=1 Tax=Paludibacterium paludis TaxID=1225769 RepID=A0A918NX59_9NEIS|nr:2OG-Fe(II) oxygenase [Paludibacterium paludis]GGY03431.1 hypothetical protein GCM10011289_02160 [Paludibacterium paludis]